ncbi:MAG: O-antigen ligase family protein [Lachnospiraceae bacterium]|nr:O-antigen ligase family protein [Lachnospiraceae bacterium]
MGNNEKNKINISRKTLGNLFIFIGILVITTLEWHFFEWYQTFTRYGTLITFVALTGAFFCYVDIKDALKDKFFWIMAATDVVALINLFILGSNKGCLLIVVDFMLILYLADKIEFSRKESYGILIYVAIFFFYWTIDVKGYFKGYNTNYGGLILITGFAFLMVLMQVVNEKKLKDYGRYVGEYGRKEGMRCWYKRNWWYIPLYLFLIALAFNIISWYRSRTALMGLIALLAIMIIPEKIVMEKTINTIIIVLSTVGSVLFSGLYIVIGSMSDGGIQLFYKDLISGRNDIWSELWYAFLEKPLTGIGSSYQMKLEYMEGMLEAHSAMMDILVVHGVIVFISLCAMLIYRLLGFRNKRCAGSVDKVLFAAVICVLITGFFENYYIVQPFSLIFLCLFGIIPQKIDA